MAKTGPSRDRGKDAWSVVVRSQQAVLAGLARGECDGILPDEWLEPDNLVQGALEEGFLDLFADFPDRRQRRSIEQALFCKVLLCGRMVEAPSIAQSGRVVFHSATLLDKLGFNFRMIREGGRRTGDHRPFDEEALEDEESFMALARYHGINDLYPCRPGLALALIHFTLLAHTLRYLCLLAQAARQPRPRTKYLVVYWAGYYALLPASQVFEQVFDHMDVWQDRQQAILEALRYCEGG